MQSDKDLLAHYLSDDPALASPLAAEDGNTITRCSRFRHNGTVAFRLIFVKTGFRQKSPALDEVELPCRRVVSECTRHLVPRPAIQYAVHARTVGSPLLIKEGHTRPLALVTKVTYPI